MFKYRVLRHKRSLLAWAAMAALSQPAMAVDTQVQYLSGSDGFHPVDWNFNLTSGRNSGVSTTIGVPGSIELQGFGGYAYNTNYTNTGNAEYSYTFNVSPDWAGKKIYIVFDASSKDTTVLINGQQAGPTHQGSYYRFKYDISSLLHVGGSNTLQVTVAPNDPMLVCEYGDYWSYWGIYRPVYLQAFPQEFVERVAVNARADGTFLMDTFLNGVSTATSVSAQIQKLDGTPVGNPFTSSVAPGDTHALLSTSLQSPDLWNAETPNLYKVAVTLMSGTTPIHTISQRFGFRTVEMRPNDGLYVNGTKVHLRGFDRHVFWPTTGRSVGRSAEAVDMEALEYTNSNAVRNSHYPPDESWLDLADEKGIYLMDELSSYQKPTQTLPTALGHQLIKEMVTTNVNHPSIVFWDNGNEGGWNTALDGDFALWDPQNRWVVHPGANGAFNGFTSYHYPSYAYVSTPGTSVHLYDEFQHSIGDGGSASSLKDFWNAMMNRSGTIGGMLWALLDEDVLRTDRSPQVLDSNGSGNNDGTFGPYREREASASAIREVWSPIYLETNNYLNYPAGFNGSIVVANRYDFTNASQVKFSWRLVNFNKLASLASGHAVVSQGTAPSPNIPPGTSGTVNLQLPPDWALYDALYVTATDPKGKDLATWSFKNKDAGNIAAQNVVASGPAPASGSSDPNFITASANGTVVQFDRATGKLASVVANGRQMSLTGATLTALDTTATPVERATSTFQGISAAQSGQNFVVDVAYAPTSSLKSMRWTLMPSGWLQLNYQYSLPTTTANYRLYGMAFAYPEANIIGMRYLGKGPNRIWKNRLDGTNLDVWSKAYNTTERGLGLLTDLTGYTKAPVEFRGNYGGFLWTDVSTTEGSIWMVSGDDNTYLQVGPRLSNFYTSQSLTNPGAANGTFSFLDAIPPIADKFQVPPNLGPQSGWNAPGGATFTKTVYFKFSPNAQPFVVPKPVVNAGANAVAVRGAVFADAGSFVDVGETGSWTGLVDYGDGTGLRPLPLQDKSFRYDHAYKNPGVYNLTDYVTDAAGHVGTGTVAVTVYPTSGVTGDIDGDGAVTCRDLSIAASLVGKRSGQSQFLAPADVDGNGLIDVRDVAAISRRLPPGSTCK